MTSSQCTRLGVGQKKVSADMICDFIYNPYPPRKDNHMNHMKWFFFEGVMFEIGKKTQKNKRNTSMAADFSWTMDSNHLMKWVFVQVHVFCLLLLASSTEMGSDQDDVLLDTFETTNWSIHSKTSIDGSPKRFVDLLMAIKQDTSPRCYTNNCLSQSEVDSHWAISDHDMTYKLKLCLSKIFVTPQLNQISLLGWVRIW